MEGRTMEDVFKDYKSRRNGLIKALTVDVREFYRQCDPEKENLSLYAYPNEKWEVNLPAEEVPPELPEPVLGINFSRDGMSEEDWIKLVAVHSDAWLISLSFYFAQRFGFDKTERRKLFNMINSIPTVFEVVTGTKEAQEVSSVTAATNGSNKKRDSASKPPRVAEAVVHDDEDEEDGEEGEEDEHKDALCGHCNRNDSTDAFWICCDICEIWFHGKCVKVTPAKAQHIKQYKCPACSTKKMRI